MLRLQRYLLGELLAAFVLVAFLITGIFLAGLLLQTLQKAPEISVYYVLQAVPILLAVCLPITVPLSFLMACLLTYGRFADDNEFLAFRMGGIHPWHAAAPAICAAAFLSIGTVELSCEVNPALTSAKKAIVRRGIREIVTQMRSPTATDVNDRTIGDLEISWDGRDGEWFLDVFLTWTDPGTKATNRVTADRASVSLTDETPMRLALTLVGATMPTEDASGGTTVGTAGKTTIFIDPEQDRAGTKSKDEMRAAELFYRVARLDPIVERSNNRDAVELRRKFLGEYWRRIALGLSPLAFALLGVPLGLVVRRGSRGQALVLALFIALPVYYPLLLWGDNLSRMGALPPAVAFNLANLLLAGVGAALLVRVSTR